jgi:hypothetical protein
MHTGCASSLCSSWDDQKLESLHEIAIASTDSVSGRSSNMSSRNLPRPASKSGKNAEMDAAVGDEVCASEEVAADMPHDMGVSAGADVAVEVDVDASSSSIQGVNAEAQLQALEKDLAHSRQILRVTSKPRPTKTEPRNVLMHARDLGEPSAKAEEVLPPTPLPPRADPLTRVSRTMGRPVPDAGGRRSSIKAMVAQLDTVIATVQPPIASAATKGLTAHTGTLGTVATPEVAGEIRETVRGRKQARCSVKALGQVVMLSNALGGGGGDNGKLEVVHI